MSHSRDTQSNRHIKHLRNTPFKLSRQCPLCSSIAQKGDRKRSSKLFKCRFRPRYVSRLARQSSENCSCFVICTVQISPRQSLYCLTTRDERFVG
eukprot:2242712-Pleurochrysis_carterae.AAC.1